MGNSKDEQEKAWGIILDIRDQTNKSIAKIEALAKISGIDLQQANIGKIKPNGPYQEQLLEQYQFLNKIRDDNKTIQHELRIGNDPRAALSAQSQSIIKNQENLKVPSQDPTQKQGIINKMRSKAIETQYGKSLEDLKKCGTKANDYVEKNTTSNTNAMK